MPELLTITPWPDPVLDTLWHRGLRTPSEIERFLAPSIENLLDLLAPADRAAHVREHMEFTTAIYDFFGSFVGATKERRTIAQATLNFTRKWGALHFGKESAASLRRNLERLGT